MSSIAQRIGAHLSRDWLRFVAPVFAIGALIWILSSSSASDSRLLALEERVDGLNFRVSRIAAALPELRERVAYEAVFSPFSVAVLTLPPVASGGDRMSETIFLVEASSGDIAQYRLSWTRDDPGVALAVAGALRTLDPRAISVAEEERLARTLREPAAHLPAIDRDQSFVLYQPAAAVSQQLQKIGAKKERVQAGSPVLNWAQFARVLETSTWLRSQASEGQSE